MVHSGGFQLVSHMPATRADRSRPTRVLVCIENMGVRELIGLILVGAGCAVVAMDVLPWLNADSIPEPRPDVLILDAWPLRHAEAAAQAHVRLAAQPAAIILLIDSLQPVQLAAELGAIVILPLLFTLRDLVAAVQQGASARGGDAQAVDAVDGKI